MKLSDATSFRPTVQPRVPVRVCTIALGGIAGDFSIDRQTSGDGAEVLFSNVTSSPGRFPAALRSSAVARWSHRDPVEGGNRLPLDDSRHEAWHAATCSARDVLVRIDRELDEAEEAGPHPDPYPVRLVALAVSRFDVWARRVQSIVRSPAALRDYEVWLTTYVAHWLVYVADTCPRADVGDDLRARLSSRAQYWVAEASRALQAVDGPNHTG
jgi:hypothetical protein